MLVLSCLSCLPTEWGWLPGTTGSPALGTGLGGEGKVGGTAGTAVEEEKWVNHSSPSPWPCVQGREGQLKNDRGKEQHK